MPLIVKLLLIAGGASLGAICRYLMEHAMDTAVAVWVINVSSCFLMGFIFAWIMGSDWAEAHRQGAHVLLLTGFVGGYATFAHYVFYCVDYFKSGHLGLSALYLVTSVAAGLLFMAAGLWLGSKV